VSCSRRLAVLGGEALVEALDALEAGRARVHAAGSSARDLRAQDQEGRTGAIDWTRPRSSSSARCAPSIRGRSRARSIRRGASSTMLRARASGTEPARRATVLEAGAALRRRVRQWRARVPRAQAAGKRALPPQEFLRGARLERRAVGTSPDENATR
jgi:methionyl-tRNA formyltransferase